MAAARTKNGTISGTTTVTLDQDYSDVEVLNRDATLEIFFTVDGTTPTVNGDNCYCVIAKNSICVPCRTFPSVGTGQTSVIMVSSGSPAYSVTGMSGIEVHRGS